MESLEIIEILMVEDNPDDIELTGEALKEVKFANRLHIARDGVEALQFLKKEGPFADAPRPHLILLDLNMPRMNGKEVLAVIKEDASLRRIPVVVLTTSQTEDDVADAYDLHANCYVQKPVDLDKFITVVQSIEQFWIGIVRLDTSEE